MVKKFLILLVVTLIFITAIVYTPLATVLSRFVTRSGHSVTSVDSSSPIMTVVPTIPADPTSTPTTGQMGQTAICFAPADILPFAFMPDSFSILVRAKMGMQIFNLDTQKEASFPQAPKNIITAALSHDGQILAWALDDNTIQLLHISDQKVFHTLSGHTDMVTKLRFSPGGDFLVSASHDNWVRVWNLDGEELDSFQAGALGIGISPNGSMLATVPSDGPVTLWNLATGEKIKELGGSGGYDTSDAEFSPDGQYLAADLVTGIYMWRISDGNLVWNEVKNSMAVTFSPDGRYLAFSDVDDSNKVILAAADTAQFTRVIDKMQSPVWELFFSPDASLLAATDGVEIRIWQVEDGTLLSVGKATCP